MERNVGGTVETWQVYGVGGELLAEYAANGTLQKEYGYRNGQLLITATVTSGGGWGAPPPLEDNPLNPPNQPKSDVKAIHITQLRTAINAVRAHYNLGAYQWQKPTASGGAINNSVLISWEPIDEMRTALNEALGPPPAPGYAGGLAQNQPILAIHIQELRDRVLAAWNNGGSGGPDIRWLVSDQLGTPRMVFDQSGSLASVSRHDYLPFGEDMPSSLRTGVSGYGANDGARQKFTLKERDNETGLDYFEARYYGSMQGRFTRPDPYNIVLETQAAAEMNEDKARAQFFNYLSHPQNWNRYAYVTNNPLKYIDPTGEELWLTGTEDERKQELERIRNLVGKDAAKYLTTREVCTNAGTVTVVEYSSNAFAAYQPEVTTRIANIIDSKDVLEYHIATTFQDKNGNHTTEYFGGAATVGKEESLNGHTQIFVNPNGSDIAQNVLGVPSVLAGSRSNDGKPLDFYDDIVDYHEFGHAYTNMIDRVNVNSDQSNQRSLDFENVIRQRRGLSNRRVRH